MSYLDSGGEIVEFTQVVFSEGDQISVQLGNDGGGADKPCYSGISGDGYVVTVGSGGSISVVLPPHSARASVGVRGQLVGGGDWEYLTSVDIIERPWPTALFHIRRSFPPWAAVGARRLEMEDEREGSSVASAPNTWGGGGKWGVSKWGNP